MAVSYEQYMGIARRLGNLRRKELLVNDLQAKHVPAKPSLSLEMMTALAKKASALGAFDCVIAFAETATAIGAVVAAHAARDVLFIHSTREQLPERCNCFEFKEEHSHATGHRIVADAFTQVKHPISNIMLIDDEISTGKTARNAVRCIRENIVGANSASFKLASVVSRLSPRDKASLKDNEVATLELLELSGLNIDATHFDHLFAPVAIRKKRGGNYWELFDCRGTIPNPRVGVRATQYCESCISTLAPVVDGIGNLNLANAKVVVLGTEECMYPALQLAYLIEKGVPTTSVVCHATTRSPIWAANQEGYPIKNGYKFRSPYDQGRESFLYNIGNYDIAIVVSDANLDSAASGMGDIAELLQQRDCGRLVWVAI